MNATLEKLGQFGVVPVVVLDDAKDAKPLAKALCDGGLACAEVTFRTDAAEESIRIMTEAYPEMIVGAGTVLTTEQADRAIAAGARFIVTPGLDPEIVRHCIAKNIPITTGVVTPSELAQAYALGLRIVKFFPAEPSGGLPMIKALAAPYYMMQFMPTGGISAATLPDYLRYEKIFACGGSWMVKGDLIKSGDFDKITSLTKEAVELVRSIREV